jgi:anti-sigma B factor antagonist
VTDTATAPVVGAVRGDLDFDAAPALRVQLNDAIAEHPGATIHVDMRLVTFMDSVGLGVLIFAYKRAVRAGGSLVVVEPSRRVRNVLETTGMARILWPSGDGRG